MTKARVRGESRRIALSEAELREVTGYAADCASRALAIFERYVVGDARPRAAIEAAYGFARGGRRTAALRDHGWAAYRAAQAAAVAAIEAGRAASHAAAAAYLHPLAQATQVKHLLGAAGHAARAMELEAEGDPRVASDCIEWARQHAPAGVVAVLLRLPAAPEGGGRVGELIRELDAALRR